MTRSGWVGVTGLAMILAMLSGAPVWASVTVLAFQGKVVKVAGAGGLKVERVEGIESVVPGDTVVYRYVVRNQGERDADSVVVNTAIPDNMTYEAKSAVPGPGGADVLLSADGGKSYSAEEDLMVFDVDETWRPARPEDVTHLRWRLRSAVPPQGAEVVEYRAVLR